MAPIPSVKSLKSLPSESGRRTYMSHGGTVMYCLSPLGQGCSDNTELLEVYLVHLIFL